MSAPSCTACSTSPARLECTLCGDHAFCSEACSDSMAQEHAQVCYDVDSDDRTYLAALAELCGLQHVDGTVDDMHDDIQSYLEAGNTFDERAMHLIDASLFRRKKRAPVVKRKKRRFRLFGRRKKKQPPTTHVVVQLKPNKPLVQVVKNERAL